MYCAYFVLVDCCVPPSLPPPKQHCLFFSPSFFPFTVRPSLNLLFLSLALFFLPPQSLVASPAPSFKTLGAPPIHTHLASPRPELTKVLSLSLSLPLLDTLLSCTQTSFGPWLISYLDKTLFRSAIEYDNREPSVSDKNKSSTYPQNRGCSDCRPARK